MSSEGTLTMAPRRLVTWNTPEAEVADHEAEADIAQKRYRTFENAGAFTADLEGRGRPAAAPQKGGPTLKQKERTAILKALQASHGNRARAADILGIDRKTFVARLKQHRLLATTKA